MKKMVDNLQEGFAERKKDETKKEEKNKTVEEWVC